MLAIGHDLIEKVVEVWREIVQVAGVDAGRRLCGTLTILRRSLPEPPLLSIVSDIYKLTPLPICLK